MKGIVVDIVKYHCSQLQRGTVLYKRVGIYTRPVRCQDHCPTLTLETLTASFLSSIVRGHSRFCEDENDAY